jgi:hypothetical protein
MLKLGSIRWRGKCPRHPGYDPYTDGRGAIRGNCEKCTTLAEIHETHQRMVAMMRGFAPPVARRRPENAAASRQTSLFD